MVARDLLLACAAPARGSTWRTSPPGAAWNCCAGASGCGLPVTGETAPHYFTLTDDAVRTFDTRFKMNPPLRETGRRRGAAAGAGAGHGGRHRHRPRSPRDRREGCGVRGRRQRGDRPGDQPGAVASAVPRRLGFPCARSWRLSPAGRRGPWACPAGPSRPGRRPTWCWWTWRRSTPWTPPASSPRRATAPSTGMRVKRKVVRTLAGGKTVYVDGRIAAENLETAETR